MQREEPYLVLTSTEVFRDENVPSGTVRQVLPFKGKGYFYPGPLRFEPR